MDSPVDKFEKLRPVGRLERWSTARHYLKFYLNVAVTATYTLPSTYPHSLRNAIYKACETLIGQHPILSAIPVREDTNDPYYARLPAVDLDKCVFFQARQQSSSDAPKDPELDELLSTQHNTPFASPYPFWRLCILTKPDEEHQFTAAFVYHHALGDGSSGKAFHRTFLLALGNVSFSEPLSSAGDVNSVVASPNVPLLPNLEAIDPMAVSIPFLLRVLFKAKLWDPKDPGLWTGSKVFTPLQSEVRHLAFTESETTHLRDLCRQKGVTLTAMLHTVVAGALFAKLPNQFTKLKCTGALSKRRWLEGHIDEDSIGVWVQDFDDEYHRDNFRSNDGIESIFPWAEAVRAKRTIENVLNAKGKNAMVNMLKYVGDYHNELFLSKLGKDRSSSYEISNLGLFKSGAAAKGGEIKAGDERPRIGKMLFSQSGNVIHNAFNVSSITGEDGRLTLAFCWQQGVVEPDLISAVIETVENELRSGFGSTQ